MLKLLGKNTVTVGERKLRVDKKIAEGGFSIVYLARQTNEADKGKQFALKIVICQTEEQVQGARREMHVHRTCKHPNVLPLVDFDIVQNKNNRGHHDALFVFPVISGGKNSTDPTA
jgi:serine/threonine protein kinase